MLCNNKQQKQEKKNKSLKTTKKDNIKAWCSIIDEKLYHPIVMGRNFQRKSVMCMEFEQIDEKRYSDNPIVDSVLRIKFGRAKARGIKVETSIRIPRSYSGGVLYTVRGTEFCFCFLISKENGNQER